MRADGRRLYVGDAISDAVAVIDTGRLTAGAAKKGFVEPIGFVPTEWMPMSMAVAGGKLFVATAKGRGTGPNNFAQRQTEGTKEKKRFQSSSTYIGTLLYGSVAALDMGAIEREMPRWTSAVLEDNRMKAARARIRFAVGGAADVGDGGGGGGSGVLGREAGSSASPRSDNQEGNAGRTAGEGGPPAGFPGPIRHVIYIIKENRTYDQVFGDLEQGGRPVGNGDKGLTMYGAEVTPNQHRMALQFGVLDNFFDSGEVSGDGHVWSNAAIGTDYLEKTWQANYRGSGADVRLRGNGGGGVSDRAAYSGCERAGERVPVGQPGAARANAVPLWRVHLDQLLQREDEWELAGGTGAGGGSVRATDDQAGGADSGGVGGRGEPVWRGRFR